MTVPHGLKHLFKTRLTITDYTEKLISLVGLQSYKIDKPCFSKRKFRSCFAISLFFYSNLQNEPLSSAYSSHRVNIAELEAWLKNLKMVQVRVLLASLLC